MWDKKPEVRNSPVSSSTVSSIPCSTSTMSQREKEHRATRSTSLVCRRRGTARWNNLPYPSQSRCHISRFSCDHSSNVFGCWHFERKIGCLLNWLRKFCSEEPCQDSPLPFQAHSSSLIGLYSIAKGLVLHEEKHRVRMSPV